ncbi:MAG: DNA polymerase III subunit gamma/tau, partial [Gordonia sp. (in: high G+C Gram-positive bacteria)]
RATVHPPVESDPRAPEPPVRDQGTQRGSRPAQAPPHDDIPLPPEPPMESDYIPEPERHVAKAPVASAAPKPEPEKPSGLTVEAVTAKWPEIRAAVRKQSTVLEAMLSAAFVHHVDSPNVVLGHPHSALVGRLSDDRGLRALNSAVTEVFGPGLSVSLVHAQPGSAPASAQSPSNEQAQSTPQRRQTYTRPSQPQGGQAAEASREATPELPEPEAPPVPDEELTHAERAEMVEQAQTGTPDHRLDPDQVALELLKSELGARPVE